MSLVLFIVKIHTHGPSFHTFPINCPPPPPPPAASLPHFSVFLSPGPFLRMSVHQLWLLSPSLEEPATACFMGLGGSKGPSVGTGCHSVQVEGPGYIPVGISKQDVRETGLQHVQGQEGGLLHHLEENRSRDENLERGIPL